MKWLKPALLLVLVLSGTIVSDAAMARGHFRLGVYVGGPVFWPGYGPYYYPPYYPPYYPAYYPPVVVTPPAAPVYIEQGAAQAAPAQDSWWYYCNDAKAYYPYVKECPTGWQRVAPQPGS